MQKTLILIVDDELGIVKYLQANLRKRGFDTEAALNGNAALQLIETHLPDLIILDIIMPEMDGFEVVSRVREWSQVPIIMLSSLSNEKEKVKCLEAGADDYIPKPFGIDELIARIEAVLRRSRADTIVIPRFKSGPLNIDYTVRRVTIGGSDIKLTPTEYALLKELTLNPGKVLTHAYLLKKVWGPEYGEEREYLHVFIAQLRSKLKKGRTRFKRIITVPGVGYEFQNATD